MHRHILSVTIHDKFESKFAEFIGFDITILVHNRTTDIYYKMCDVRVFNCVRTLSVVYFLAN